MRQVINPQLQLGEQEIGAIVLDPKSRVVIYPPLIFPTVQTLISRRDITHPLWQAMLQHFE